MRSTSKYLFLTTALTIIALSISDCPKGSCLKCEVIDEANSCTRCAHRITDLDNNECGSSIEDYINENHLDKHYFKHCEGIEVSANKARCFLCQ